MAVRPFQSVVNVYSAADPVLDSWRGARRFAVTDAMTESCISAAEYHEKGGQYLKEHAASNRYLPSSSYEAVL